MLRLAFVLRSTEVHPAFCDLLNSWEEAPLKRLVKSYKSLHFKGNILKITPRGAY